MLMCTETLFVNAYYIGTCHVKSFDVHILYSQKLPGHMTYIYSLKEESCEVLKMMYKSKPPTASLIMIGRKRLTEKQLRVKQVVD